MEFNPYSRALHADPYPTYARLREEAPACRNERWDFWVISRYDDVQGALKDCQTYSSASGITAQTFAGFKPMIILMDPPRQAELRALLQRAFTPRRIAGLEDTVRGTARSLIDQFLPRGGCEFTREFAAPFPTTVIAELLGIDRRDHALFKQWSDAIMTSRSVDADSLRQAYDHIFEYFADVIATRRAAPREDLVSALVGAEAEGKRLTEDELLGFCALLLIAGNETMANFLANALLVLDRHGRMRRELLAEPALFASAVEELLRFEPPVHEVGRTLTRDVELHGRTIPSGSRVLLLLAAANRDPACFPDAERFDIRRAPNPHLSFGLGPHFCMGAGLARLEARVALEELLSALPEYRVAADDIGWFRTPSVRGPSSLPIEFPPRRRGTSGGRCP